MHSMCPPAVAPQSLRIRLLVRRVGRLPAALILLVMLLGSAMPGFAQTWLQNLPGMNGPTLLALDTRNGTDWLYVSEHGETDGTGGGRILRFNLTTGSTTPQLVASAGTGDGQFRSPDGIVVDPATGDLFIADRALHRVQRIAVNLTTGAGTFVMKWGQNVAGAVDEMSGPLGLARDSAGAIYVSEHDASGNRVSKYTVSGTTATRVWRVGAVGTGNGQFNTPYGIAISGSNLLISDGFNYRVQIWDLNGVYQNQFSIGADTIPLGLFIDSAGALWLAEANAAFTTPGTTQRVMKRTLAGVPTGVTWGTQGSGNGQFSLPFHAVVSADGTRAYVADYGNDRVQVFTIGGTDTTAPTVTAFAVASSTASSVTYQLVFSEAVTGVNSADFTAVRAGSTGGTATVGTVSGSGTTYSIPVSFTGTGGTVTLNLNASATGIQDSASNALVGGASGPAHTVAGGGSDTTAPTVANLDFISATSTAGSFGITFSESVTGVTADDFYTVTTGNTTPTITTVTGSGASYTINFTYVGSAGAMQLRIRPTGTGIVDAAGNAFAGGGVYASGVVANAVGTGDTTVPTVVSFNAGAGSGGAVPFTVTFSEAVSGVAASAFTATGAGSSVGSVISTGTDGSAYIVNVNYTGTTGSLTLALNATANSAVRDFAGNAYAGGGTTSATFTVGTGGGDTTPPTVASLVVASSTSTSVTYQLVFNEAVTGVNASDFAATRAGSAGGTVTVEPVTGSGTTYTIPVSFTGVGGTVQLSLNATGTGIQDAAGNALVGGSTGPVHTVPTGGDVTPPTLATFTIAGSTSTSVTYQLVFSEAVTGVNESDFTAARSGSTGAATLGALTPLSGSTYQQVVNFTGANGTVGLTLNATGTGIQDTAGNALVGGGAGPIHTVATVPSVPVVTAATVSGTVGSALSAQIVANGTPTSYALVSGTLPGGLSLGTTTGVVSGTPTAASSAAVSVTATNAGGTSAPATITFSIQAAPPPPPPPPSPPPVLASQQVLFTPGVLVVGEPLTLTASATSGLPVTFSLLSGDATLNNNVLTANTTGSVMVRAVQLGNSSYSSARTDVTLNALSRQTIAFSSPVSAIVINQPLALSATSSAGLPVTFSVVSGSADLTGTTLTPRGPGPIVVRASQAGSTVYAPASAEVDFGSPQRAAQLISLANLPNITIASGPITLNATSSSGLPVTYAVTGPVTLAGNQLTPTGVSGTVTVRALQAGNDSYNPAAEVVRSFLIRALGQQVYLGTAGANPFGAGISADNTKGVFITRLASNGHPVVVNFDVSANGAFTGKTTVAGSTYTVTGTVLNGVLTGSIVELNQSFTANVQSASGPTASLVGVYRAQVPGSASGDTYLVAGPNGQAFGVVITPSGTQFGTGTITPAGAVNVTTSGGGAIAGTVTPASGTFAGTFTAAGATSSLVGLSDNTTRTDRLVNVSSRLRVATGDASRSVIAGFVVAGTESKPVLVRAVGPGLSGFGVTGVLSNPRLQIYRGTTLVAENEDWSNDAQVSATVDRVGAFRLGTGSLDAAVVSTLAPGAYTVVVMPNGGAGVALIEVYDAATNVSLNAQQLVNISTRGFVDTGDGQLIAGFVVSGNAPKRVLIRAVGPGLTQFGVPGVVTDPVLTLFAADNPTAIAQNNNWGTGQPIDSRQTTATTAEIAAASTASGAFPLENGSNDAAMIITLMPGAYSAVVSGANNGTGAGLIEVYEIPNP